MKILLIDADVVAYLWAYKAEQKLEWKPGYWMWTADMNQTAPKVDDWLNTQLETTECDDLIVIFSSPENYRLSIEPSYKSNRKDKYRPLLVDPIREHLETSWRTLTYPNIEADDAMGIIATSETKHEYIIASIDKDLDQIPGSHWNWSKPELGIYEVTEEAGLKKFYSQALSGDPVDGYPGCPGFGSVTSDRLVEKNWPNPWNSIVEKYKKKDLPETYAVRQAQMAKILTAGEYEPTTGHVHLWSPPA